MNFNEKIQYLVLNGGYVNHQYGVVQYKNDERQIVFKKDTAYQYFTTESRAPLY